MKYLPVNFLLMQLFKEILKHYRPSKKALEKPLLSVIVPSYNEAENVPILVKKLALTLKRIPHEIVIVDDNSPDRTWEIAQKLIEEHPQLHVIRRVNTRGLSSAVLAGMAASKGEVLAVMDADMQHDESILPNILDAIKEKNYDIVVASRKVAEGSYGEFSFLRRVISKIANLISRLMLPLPVDDPMSGFFALKRKLYEEKIDKINSIGFKILIEFLWHNPQARVIELPYTFRKRVHGKTKLSASVVRHFFMALWNLRFGRFVSAHFVLYAGVGFTGMFINLAAFTLGEFLQLPRIDTGFLKGLDPIWTSLPFGVQISILCNYFLNNYITFYETRYSGFFPHLKGFIRYQLISFLGLLIQWSVFQVLYSNAILENFVAPEFSKYVCNFIGILAATASNYHLNLNYTWKNSA